MQSDSLTPNSPQLSSPPQRSSPRKRKCTSSNATELSPPPKRSSPRKRKCTSPANTSQSSSPSKKDSPRKRKLTSPAWGHFERVEINGVIHGVCHKCHEKIRAPLNNGTKSLLNHMNKHCPTRGGQVDIRQKLLSTSEANDGIVKIGSFTFDQDISRKDLASVIVMHEYPLSIVEHVGFRKLINGLQPLFKMPLSRNTIKNDILKLYEVEKTKTYMMFEELLGHVAITTDLWTSRQRKGYMAITAHFIDVSWHLQNMIIGRLTTEATTSYLLYGPPWQCLSLVLTNSCFC